MTDTRAKRQDGVRTLEDLRARCVIDGETLCWVWRGATVTNAKGRGTDVSRVWLPAEVAGRPQVMTASRAAWLLDGNDLPPGHVVWRSRCHCRELCINPQHGAAGTRRQMFDAFIANGRLRGDPRRAVVNARNREGMLLPVDIVRRGEALFAAGALQKAVRAELGISAGAARRIRLGVHPRSAGRDRVVANASVFAMKA